MSEADAPFEPLFGPEPFVASALYDEAYAERYDDTWWDSETWAADGAYYSDLFARHLPEGGRWLDVGCGTGWMLSQRPSSSRGGVDAAAPVLAKAREANPDAELRCADVLAPHPPWDDAWDLVTCTGQPWSYLRTLSEFETWVENMAAWTSPDGTCINQVPDILELTGNPTAYHFPPEEPPVGLATVLAVHWTMDEPTSVHGPMIWPSMDIWVRWFARHFARIEVVHADPSLGLRFPRAIVATEKRTATDDGRLVVVAPAEGAQAGSVAGDGLAWEANAERWAENQAAWEANERAWNEEQERWAANAEAWREHEAFARAESARANAAEAALARGSVATASTRNLATALLARLRPTALVRRVRRRTR